MGFRFKAKVVFFKSFAVKRAQKVIRIRYDSLTHSNLRKNS